MASDIHLLGMGFYCLKFLAIKNLDKNRYKKSIKNEF